MIQNLSGKRIVMTGATGFIGSHVAERFLEEGAEVYCLVRPQSQKTDCLPVHEHLHRIAAQMDEAVACVPQIGHAERFCIIFPYSCRFLPFLLFYSMPDPVQALHESVTFLLPCGLRDAQSGSCAES